MKTQAVADSLGKLQSTLIDWGWSANQASQTEWFFFHLAVPVILSLLAYYLFLKVIGEDNQGKPHTRVQAITHAAFWGGWLICALILIKGGQAPAVETPVITETTTEPFPLLKVIWFTLVGLVTLILSIRPLRSSFLIDKRNVVEGQEPSPPPRRPFWRGLISIFGCGASVAMILVWPVYCSLAFVLFWILGGSFTVPYQERWVPYFFQKPKHRKPEKEEEEIKRSGIYKFYEVGLRWSFWPTWMPFFSLWMVRYATVERTYVTDWLPLSNLEVCKVRYRLNILTCSDPSRFLRMSTEDQASSINVAGRLSEDLLAPIVATLELSKAKQMGSDVFFKPTEEKPTNVHWDELNRQLLESIGSSLEKIKFGDVTPDPEIEQRTNALAAERFEAQRKALVGDGDGAQLEAEIKAVARGLGLVWETATPQQKLAVLQQIQRTAESKQSRHVVPRKHDEEVALNLGVDTEQP